MAEVTLTPNHVAPPACYPADMNSLLDALTTGGGITGTVPDNAGGGIYVGSSPPSSSLTNKVWYKIDTAGRPLGVFMFYNGNWRKVYTGVALGEIRMCLYYSGHFDGSGRGNIGGDYDGWAQCNGQNGTPNLEGYFPVPGLMGEVVGGTAGVFYANADGLGFKPNGGQRGRITLTMANMPPMVAHSYVEATQAGGGGIALTIPGQGSATTLPVTDTSGNPSGSQALPFQHLFQALGFLMFIGYQ